MLPSRRAFLSAVVMLTFLAGGICIGVGASGVTADTTAAAPTSAAIVAGVILVIVASAAAFLVSLERFAPPPLTATVSAPVQTNPPQKIEVQVAV